MIIIFSPSDIPKELASIYYNLKDNELKDLRKQIIKNLINQDKFVIRDSSTMSMLKEDVIDRLKYIEQPTKNKIMNLDNAKRQEFFDDIVDYVSSWSGWDEYVEYIDDLIEDEANNYKNEWGVIYDNYN